MEMHEETRNYPEPQQEIQVHAGDVNPPETMEYVPCLYYPQFDYGGFGVRIWPKVSQINYASLGDKLRTWGDGRVEMNWMVFMPGGHLAIGAWREVNGTKYISVNGPGRQLVRARANEAAAALGGLAPGNRAS